MNFGQGSQSGVVLAISWPIPCKEKLWSLISRKMLKYYQHPVRLWGQTPACHPSLELDWGGGAVKFRK